MAEQETNQEQKAEQEQESKQESTAKQGKKSGHQEGSSSQSQETSPANVLEFLRKSNIINMDMPLKTLFENIQSLQPDPSSSWGVIGDSGHLVLVWKG